VTLSNGNAKVIGCAWYLTLCVNIEERIAAGKIIFRQGGIPAFFCLLNLFRGEGN
jgi:hypothetical protein